MFKTVLIVLCACTIGIMGCSASSEIGNSPDSAKTEPDLMSTDPNYRAAMDHFISGNLNDVKGDYAQAILDYQEALMNYKAPDIYDAMSKDYMRLGKPKMAIDQAKMAVNFDPNRIRFLRTLAEAYLSDFNIDSARIQYQKILSMDSTDIGDMLVLARLYEKDQPKKAAELYQKSLTLTGPDLATMMQLVRIYNTTNEYEKSISVAEAMLRLDPCNVALKEMLVDLYMQVGRNADALNILKAMMAGNKNDYALMARAATVYLRMKNFSSADSLLDTIFTSDSTRADAKFAIGQFYLNEMQQDSSIVPFAQEIFAKLLKLYPNDARSYLMAGLGASSAHEDSAAAVYLKKSIALDSTSVNAWQALGILYYQNKDYARMASVMSSAVKFFPDDYRVNLFLGLALNQEGKNEDAVSPLEKALSIKPTETDALSILGQVYEALHRYDDAYRLYETALKLDSRNSLILNNFAYSLSERGIDLQRALEMAKRAIELDPRNSAYLDTMGWVYFKLGDYRKAEEFVRKALSERTKADGSPETLEEHLGDIYEKLGDTSKAVEQWKKALQSDPTKTDLKEKIEKAKS